MQSYVESMRGAAAAPVKAAAEPFISWLTEADEESDDDDGGDE